MGSTILYLRPGCFWVFFCPGIASIYLVEVVQSSGLMTSSEAPLGTGGDAPTILIHPMPKRGFLSSKHIV